MPRVPCDCGMLPQQVAATATAAGRRDLVTSGSGTWHGVVMVMLDVRNALHRAGLRLLERTLGQRHSRRGGSRGATREGVESPQMMCLKWIRATGEGGEGRCCRQVLALSGEASSLSRVLMASCFGFRVGECLV